MKQCSFCNKSVYKLAKGLCANCYYRQQRNGTPDYVKVRNPCTVAGCNSLSVAKGLCEAHYRNMRKHGAPVSERSEKWGHRSGHPLYDSWRHMRRTHVAGPEWNEFWDFVRDVGERRDRHRLKRLDEAKLFGPNNFFWEPPSSDVSTVTLADRREWQRVYRINNPDKAKDADLKRHYKISLAEYNRKLELQDHKCGICRKPEKGKRRLAVDHCHSHGHHRGLLCSACNTAIGLFGDDPETMIRAAKYVAGHTPS